jgi:hypothetical protein
MTALLMARNHLADPYDPSRQGTAAYGHNHPGALLQGLVVTLVELAVVYLILRPGSYRHSWGRAALALAIFLPGAAASAVLTMHTGGIYSLHFLWMASVVLILVGCGIWSAGAALLERRRAGSPDLPRS